MTDVKSMTMEELKEFMTKIGEKPFRAKQIYAWLHQQLVTSWDEMTNLSKSLREKLSAYPITALTQADVRISKIDGTRKYLFQLEDGNVIAIQGFGSFEVKKKAERISINPSTKQRMLVPPKLVLSYRPSNTLKDKFK